MADLTVFPGRHHRRTPPDTPAYLRELADRCERGEIADLVAVAVMPTGDDGETYECHRTASPAAAVFLYEVGKRRVIDGHLGLGGEG